VEYLSKLGVAVVVEPKLPNCVFDGAAMISERAVPVIGLTLRLDRIDYFWFTLLHELAHVWLHLSDTSESFIDRMESSDADSLVEREANKVARDGLIPPSVWKRSEAFLNPTAESIRRLADDLHIHPAIVAGRVQFESKRYERFRELLGQGKVRNHFSDVF
jgi:HTH-type transcriptional regulator/antitoxin HigA